MKTLDKCSPTRFYSSKQEKNVSKKVGGKQTPNSGATAFVKGDVITDDWLIECKTVIGEKKSFTVRKEWLEKNKEESFAMNKPYSALAFSFGDDINYYILDEDTFILLMNKLREED